MQNLAPTKRSMKTVGGQVPHARGSRRLKFLPSLLVVFLMVGSCLLSMISLPVNASTGIQPLDGSPQSPPQTNPDSANLPNMFPKSPAPGPFYAVNLGTDATFDFPLAALEGLVARVQPRLFLIEGSQDNSWLNYTAQSYGLSYQYVKSTGKAGILQTFKSYVTDGGGKVKVVLYDSKDPIYPTQLEMALTLAGVKNALPVSSGELPAIQSIFGTSNIRIIQNLSGRFTDKVAAYSWLWNNVQGSVTRKFLVISPAGVLGLADYIVENKAFAFEFSTTVSMTSQQSALASTILGAFPQLAPVLGYFGLGGEGPTIGFLSPRGLPMVTSDSVTNLSLYSGLPDATNLSQVPPGRSLTYNPSKTYIMFSYTQGNSLGYLFYGYKSQWDMLDSNGQYYRAELPEAWQINPLAAELAPPLMKYYYSTMTANDSFYTGPSGGAGYVYPELLPSLTSYLSLAKPFNTNANINGYFLITQQKKWNPTLYQQYVTDVSPSAIFIKGPTGQPEIVSGVPVMSMTYKSVESSTFNSSVVSSTVSDLKSLSGTYKFIFFFLGATNPGMPFIKAVIQKLGSQFVAVRSDEFASLYKQSLGPGPEGTPSSVPGLLPSPGPFLTVLPVAPLTGPEPPWALSPLSATMAFSHDAAQ
jgi:hypothetical protein